MGSKAWDSFEEKLNLEVVGRRPGGLNTYGSCTQFVLELYDVYENSDKQLNVRYEYDSLIDNVDPSYVQIKVFERTSGPAIVRKSTFNESVSCLFDIIKKKINHENSPNAIFGNEFDVLVAFKSSTWSKVAMEWIRRKRTFGWSSFETVNTIGKKVCHIVPTDCNEIDGLKSDWKLSFCIAERLLVSSFNHTQLLLCALLQILVGEIIAECIPECILSDILTNTLFWVIEETHSSMWNPTKLLLCFHVFLERLIQFLVAYNCPNYFVPIHNLFIHRLNNNAKTILLQKLFDITGSGMSWILESRSLRHLVPFLHEQNTSDQDWRQAAIRNETVEINKLVFSVIYLCRLSTNTIINNHEACLVPHIKSLLKSPVIRQEMYKYLGQLINTSQSTFENKYVYAWMRTQIRLLSTESIMDASSGKALLATLLYKQGCYNKRFVVTDSLLQNIEFRMFYNGEF